jgi:hypothetical protein
MLLHVHLTTKVQTSRLIRDKVFLSLHKMVEEEQSIRVKLIKNNRFLEPNKSDKVMMEEVEKKRKK